LQEALELESVPRTIVCFRHLAHEESEVVASGG
jgi:hypothetical protein